MERVQIFIRTFFGTAEGRNSLLPDIRSYGPVKEPGGHLHAL
jgi:hypothetical protein